MNSLVKELIQPLLEETTKTVAIFPGKFKPPHKGHYAAATELAQRDYIKQVNIITFRC